ncbi:MAG: 2Fe-2S iron-sulfur cluster-binding protein [Pseudomonadota bacterium]
MTFSHEARVEQEPLFSFTVRLADASVTHQALAGMHLVELMQAHGLPVKAECGGAGACATCHVRVPAAWQDVLPPPSEEELAKLDEIPGADDASRLACQITMTADLDGIELELQPDSHLILGLPRQAAA